MVFTLDPAVHSGNLAALKVSRSMALQSGIRVQPKKTKQAYRPKQMEFMHWCEGRQFTDGCIVTEDKLLLFLDEEVAHRALKVARPGQGTPTKKRKLAEHLGVGEMTVDLGLGGTPARDGHGGKDTDDDNDNDNDNEYNVLGPSSIKQYINAINSLQLEQEAQGCSVEKTVRGPALKAFMKARKVDETSKRRARFDDRGRGTILEGYILKDVYQLVVAAWQAGCRASSQDAVHNWLRTAADFFFGHSMLLRGQNRQLAELADMFVLPLYNEGLGERPCPAVVLSLDKTKTSKTGKIQYAVFTRHKDYRICPVGHLAYYLYYRWSVMREAPPDFAARESWYQIPLFAASERSDKVSNKETVSRGKLIYNSHYAWTSKLFAAAGLASRKKTHAGRSSGAQYAELNGVAENQIRRAGHWNSDCLTDHYLSHIPREFVRVMAGFRAEQGSYYIAQDSVEPPAALLDQVWPWVDEWIRWFLRNTGELGCQG